MPIIHRFGKLRGAKEKYNENVWYSIWYPLSGLDDEDNLFEETGVCFDFAENDIDDAIALLKHLKTADVNDYTESVSNGKIQV